MKYTILLHLDAMAKVKTWRTALHGGKPAGRRFAARLAGRDQARLTDERFIEELVNTKPPQIFAESAVVGDGSDWTPEELSILGDIVIAVPVTVFDNGLHRAPKAHEPPFSATLLFVPGALLQNGFGKPAADEAEVVRSGQIDVPAFRALYARRLLPAFAYASRTAARAGRRALITVPGLGCGMFAGRFKGTLGALLRDAIAAMLEHNGSLLEFVKTVYYDPYDECDNERRKIGDVDWLVRPLQRGNQARPQLCRPSAYQEPGDDFSDCDLFSVVAWDHVSWPGNDFYGGSRATDDGVKAAATSAMTTMTGIAGQYNSKLCQYDPPHPFRTWSEVVEKNRLQIKVRGNLLVVP